MTSSEADQPDELLPTETAVPAEPNRRYSRRLKWLAAFIVLAAVAYCAAWFVIADRVEKGIDTGIARMRDEDGVSARCTNRRVGGFPFRFDLTCDAVSYENPRDNLTVQAGEFHGARQVYDPRLTVGELKGPLKIDAPLALDVSWSILEASIREARPLPSRVSIEAKELLATDPKSASLKVLFGAHQLEAHMRSEGPAVDLAARFEALRIEPDAVGGRTIPPLTGVADLSLANGVAQAGIEPATLRGATGQLRILSVAIEGGGSLTTTGPISIGTDGLIDAELKVAMVNADAVSQALQTAIPEQASTIRTAFAALALLGDQPTLPLTIRKGEARLGFIPLGKIKPID